MVNTCPVVSGTLPVLYHFNFFSKGEFICMNVNCNVFVRAH